MTATTSREAMVRCLLDDDLRKGLGDSVQLEAWREMEWRRCAASFAYFIENYGWIISKDGNVIKWTLWPTQRQLAEDLQAGHSIVAFKARQLGITTELINYDLWLVLFKDAKRVYFVSDSEEKGKEAMAKMGATYDRLPQWFKERATNKAKVGESRRKDRKEGSLGISFGLSEMKVLTSTPNSVAGVSGDIVLDEFGRHRDQKRILDNAIPAFLGGGQLVIIGNGNGEDELFRIYHKALAGDFPGMKAYFFSWRDDPNRDDEWYESTKKMYLRDNPEQDIYSFKAQYPSTVEEAAYVTGDSFFDLGMVNGISRLTGRSKQGEVRPAGEDEHFIPKFEFLRNPKGRSRMFMEPKEGSRYVIGVDTAEARSPKGDYSVAWVSEYLTDGNEIDRRANEYGWNRPPMMDGRPAFSYERDIDALDTAMVFRARLAPIAFAGEIEEIARYYNDAFVVVESNSAGGTVISQLKNTYHNLYKQVKRDMHFADDLSENIGYWENERSKRDMLNNLDHWLRTGRFFMRDPLTNSEYAKYGYDERGRLSAPKGLTDDLVIGSGLCVIGAIDIRFAPTTGAEVNYGLDW